MYKEIFAIDEISFTKRRKENGTSPAFFLKNFSYYQPKLEKNFYLKHFIKELLFETNIRDLNEFLNFHYDNCNSPDEFIEVLDYEILPKVSDIIENAEYSMTGGEYYNQKVLEDGFIETEGVIKNWQYEFDFFSHLIAVNKNKAQSRKRIEISVAFLETTKNLNYKQEKAPLQWIAGPSQLGFIISILVQNEYIKPPTTVTKNGINKGKLKINYNRLARDILTAFNISDHDSTDTLRAYLSPDSLKYHQAKNTFENNGFIFPNKQV